MPLPLKARYFDEVAMLVAMLLRVAAHQEAA